MKSCLSVILAACLALAALPAPASAQGVAGILKSRRIKQRVRLQTVETVEAGKPKTSVQFTVDDDRGDFHELPAGRSFLASGPISVTVRRFNPLRTGVTVSIDDVPDPTHATLAKLVEGLLGAATGVKAIVPTDKTLGVLSVSGGDSCTAGIEALQLIPVLDNALNAEVWKAENLKTEFSNWAGLIETGLNTGTSGPAAIQKAIEAAEKLGDAMKKALVPADKAIKRVDEALAIETPNECQQSANMIYSGIRLTGAHERHQTLHAIAKSVTAMKQSLEGYARADRWSQTDQLDFIAKHSVEPTDEKMKKVTVAFTRISYEAPAPTGLVVTKTEPAASASFIVRQYLTWVPEIGVGLTFSNPKRPKYGTAKNAAGETVIGEAETDASSLDPSILVNFVCGFCRMTAVTPMFQIGASTSKTTPAFFFGGGIRILPTAKGDFALGAGLIVPWARQLKQGIEPGKVIDGTAALENSLEWRRVEGRHVYFTIQYKF